MSSEADSFLGVSSKQPDPASPTGRYPALRVISSIYRILAVFTGIAAIIVVIIGVGRLDDRHSSSEGLLLILVGIGGGFFGVITSLAAAEAIRVFLDIEENTRNTFYSVWNAANKQ